MMPPSVKNHPVAYRVKITIMVDRGGCIANCSAFEGTTDTPAPLFCTRAFEHTFFTTRRPPTAREIAQYWTEEQCGLRSARIRPGDVVFDIGPHNGYFTMRASELVGHRGLVVAIEASLIYYHVVQNMIRCNRLSNVRLIFGAAHSVAGQQLHVYSQGGDDEQNRSTVGNTVFPDWAGKASGRRVPTRQTENRTITSVTIDSLVRELKLPRVDHIFATVNGIEMDVLVGGTQIIATHRPEVVLADRFAQRAATSDTPTLYSWLSQHGYRFFRQFDIRLGPHGCNDNRTLFASQRRAFLAPGYE